MNDLVILGIVLGAGLGSVVIGLFIWQHFEHKKSAFELKSFQMENTRLIQQMEKNATLRHDENMTFFKGLGYSVGRIVHRLDAADAQR